MTQEIGTMTLTEQSNVRYQLNCPSRETIDREKKQQDADVVSLRRMLANMPKLQFDDLTVYSVT